MSFQLNIFLFSSTRQITNMLKDLNVFHFNVFRMLRQDLNKFMHETLDFPF